MNDPQFTTQLTNYNSSIETILECITIKRFRLLNTKNIFFFNCCSCTNKVASPYKGATTSLWAWAEKQILQYIESLEYLHESRPRYNP